MFEGLRSRLTFANVIALMALFVAIGGGAYAASVAPKDSVVSKSIKDRQVKGKDLSAKAANPAYFFRGAETPAQITATNFAQSEALMASTESLPAGRYVFTLTAEFDALQGYLECNTYLGDEIYVVAYSDRADGLNDPTGTGHAPGAAQFVQAIPKGASGVDSHIELRCINESAQVAAIGNISITAIRVGSSTEI